ncbi:uncharacterized protein LOC135129494 [Zophobas morio]|uniref:uncharacterized protein LOC135129494 n=1 Tax=Zophobas morio TaxID=2755281 RepID=UPI0030829FF0
MELSNVTLLLIVNFLHSMASGLILPTLSDHIVACGGNQVLLGALCSSLYVFNTLSTNFMTLFELGRKDSLTVSAYFAFFTSLVLVFFNNPGVIWLDRCIYALTNQVNWFSKEYVMNDIEESLHIRYCNLLDVSKLLGMVLGMLLAGHVHSNGGFTTIAMAITVLAFLNIILLQYVEPDRRHLRRQLSKLLELPSECYDQLENLRDAELAAEWPMVLFLVVHTFVFTVYFSKHVYILKASYNPSLIIISYHVAYHFMLKFLCDVFVPFIQSRFRRRKSLFNLSVAICAISISALGPAPTLEVYWMFFVPMLASYTVINSLLEEDYFELRWDTSFREAVNTLQIIVNVVGPVVFGILCETFGASALYLLHIFPITVVIYLVWQWFYDEDLDDEVDPVSARRGEEDKEKED